MYFTLFLRAIESKNRPKINNFKEKIKKEWMEIEKLKCISVTDIFSGGWSLHYISIKFLVAVKACEK